MSNEVNNATPILAQPERKVTIYSTKNGDKKAITTNATSWGELKALIKREVGIDTDKFLATETVSKMTYEVDDIALPESSFYLIVRPKDTKAGADYPLNRKEIMADLKEAFSFDPSLKAKLGGNMTQIKTPELEVFHKKYIAGKEIKAPKAAAKAAPKKEAPVKKATTAKKEVAPKKVAVKKVTKKEPTPKKNVADVVDSVAKAKSEPQVEGPTPEELRKMDREETYKLAAEARIMFKK